MKGRRSVIAGVSILILFLLCSCDIFHLKVVWEEEKDLSGFVLSGDGGPVELTCPEVNAAVHYNWYLDDVLVHEGRTYAAEEFAEPAVRSYTCIATGSSDEVLFTKEYIQYHPNVDYFIYGHRHIELDLQLTKKARMIILGDWISHFSYVVFDGEHFLTQQYIEGESQP